MCEKGCILYIHAIRLPLTRYNIIGFLKNSVEEKNYVLITASSPRFLTALRFFRANLRSFVGDKIT